MPLQAEGHILTCVATEPLLEHLQGELRVNSQLPFRIPPSCPEEEGGVGDQPWSSRGLEGDGLSASVKWPTNHITRRDGSPKGGDGGAKQELVPEGRLEEVPPRSANCDLHLGSDDGFLADGVSQM